MIEDFTLLNVTSWQHWIACSHYDYHDGLIYLDIEKKSYETTKRLYVTGNFSKYIPLGAKRIEAECDDKDIMLIAFEKDNKTVLITANFSEKEKDFVIPYDGLVSVTDKGHNLTEKSVSANEKIAITPQSVTTFVF